MKIGLRVYFLLIFTMFGCNSKQLQEGRLNPEVLDEYQLSSEKIVHPALVNPLKIFSNEDFLFVFENNRISPDKPLIHVFTLPDLVYQISKGQMGFGPFEIPSADLLQPISSKNEFLVYSGMDKKMVKYSLADSSLLGIDEFRMPASNTPLGLFYLLSDSTFLGMSTFDENKFVEVDILGTKKKGFGAWDVIEGKEKMSYFHHFLLNNGWFKTDQSQEIIVNASIFRDRLEIFNINSKEIITLDGPSLELPLFEYYREDMPLNIPISNPYRYRDVYITVDKIYALYGGLTEAHFKKTGELALDVFVLTKAGVPLYRFKLDRSISSIVVDQKQEKLFGLTTDEDPGIAVFELPTDLK
ncbi:BF3164 family lipoprotein [Algoriphagus namhaensis]